MTPEARLRARCRMLLDSHLELPCWYTAIEHGRRHHGTKEQRAREWQHLQAQGVKQGIGDMLVLAPGHCLFVELKAKANKQSESQYAFQAKMAALGHGYEVVRSVEALGQALERNGVPLRAGWRVAAMQHDAALDSEPAPAVKRTGATKGKSLRRPTLGQVARGNRMALVGVKG